MLRGGVAMLEAAAECTRDDNAVPSETADSSKAY